jgi:hypothetical protein
MPLRFRSALALLVCLIATSSRAAVYVDCRAPGTIHNGASWKTAFLSISQALRSIGNGGEVWVKTGTYPESLTLNVYTTIYGGFLGFETSTSQRLPGAFPTVISAGHQGRVIGMPDAARVTLDDLTIRDGKADRGGGIKCPTNSTVTIRNCRVENCEATDYGGGVCYDVYTQGRMDNCFVTNNEAPKGAGVVVAYHSYPTLHGNVIVHNHATVSGGGVWCPFHSGALMENCTIAYNQADVNGGGVYAYYGGPVTLKSCIIAYNTAPAGGGLYTDGGTSQVTLTACDWYANSVDNLGGVRTSLPAGMGNLTSDPMFLMPSYDEFHLRLGSPCATMGAFAVEPVYPIDRIGVGKLLADGTSVKLANKVVTCVDGNTVYLQEPDRTSAIAVRGLTGCSPGRILTSVAGTLSTDGASRVLCATSFTICPNGTFDPRPLGTRLSWLSTIPGIYSLTWGRITALTPDGFEISDGQCIARVRYAGAQPRVLDFVTITGACGLDGTFLARSVLPAS